MGENNHMWGKTGKDSPIYGRKSTPEQTNKQSESMIKYIYIFKNPQGKLVEMRSIKKFCKENNLTDSLMYKVKNGKQSHHKGWTFVSKKLINKELKCQNT